MDQEQYLTPGQGLTLISQVISRTRDNIREHSFIFLLWGWLLAIASLVWFILQTQTGVTYYFIPFPVLSAIGLIVSFIYYRKHIAAKTETYLNYFIRNLWMVLSLGFVVTVFVSVSQEVWPFSYTLILGGIGTMVTGLTMKFRPLFLGGIFFLLCSLVCIFLPVEYKVLVHGVAILFGYIIPGYLLRNSKEPA
jgi:hypothetical protein